VNGTGSLTLSATRRIAGQSTNAGRVEDDGPGPATGFTFAVPGMERVLTLTSGRTLFDIAPRTTPLTLIGQLGADLVMVRDAVVTHNLAGYSGRWERPDNWPDLSDCN